MKFNSVVALAGAASILAISGAAQAATVDGVISAGEYAGAIHTHVTYTPGVPIDFSTINAGSDTEAYDVYLTSNASGINVALVGDPAGLGNDGHDAAVGLAFANLYFDTDPTVSAGSDVGFEVFNNDSFIPATGVKGASTLTDLGFQFAEDKGTTYANGGQPGVMEFFAPWSFFMTDPDGMGFPVVAPGGELVLRISQSFGYSPVGGDPTARFGAVFAPSGAVPEPAGWALMIVGFGGMGAVLRRRRAAIAA